jgi:hypothetical protein
MARRKRAQREEIEPDRPAQQRADDEAWDTPAFRSTLLLGLAFVAAPAVVIAGLREYAIAAAWLAVGVLVIVWESLPQIRGLLRALRSGGRTDQDGGEEQG